MTLAEIAEMYGERWLHARMLELAWLWNYEPLERWIDERSNR